MFANFLKCCLMLSSRKVLSLYFGGSVLRAMSAAAVDLARKKVALCAYLHVTVFCFCNQIILFGRPVASILARWGTIGRSRDAWDHKEGDLRIQARISIDLGLASRPYFERSGPNLE